jgi:glycerol-3-phosphate dehydrogenase (NAD(P)+)
MTKAVILGAGVMGSAMCLPFCDNDMQVTLVGTHLDTAIIQSVRQSGLHPKLKTTLPSQIRPLEHDRLGAVLQDAPDFILLGVSSAGVSWAIDQLAATLTRPIPIVMITKGMQPDANTLSTLPDRVARELKTRLGFDVPVAAIGGPCIAGELAVRRPTGTVIVSRDQDLARKLCTQFENSYYLPRASTDMIGVELCAAFKNFYAIAVGWAHGQNEILAATENSARNNNAAAVLFDQAIREMLVLSKALGGTPESVWGMPGAGDLYVTCQAGRNSRLGHALGRGLTYSQAKAGPLKDETVEGAELGIAVAKTLRNMVDSGAVSTDKIPLALALLDVLTAGKTFVPPWQQMHVSTT